MRLNGKYMAEKFFKKMPRALLGFVILVACFYVGNVVKEWLHLIIPGNVLGLFLLIGLLSSGVLPLSFVEQAAAWLLFILPVLFVPLYVLAAEDKSLWREWGLILVGSMVFTVVLLWAVVGHLAQYVLKPVKGDA
jgi:holin-like protein